MASSRFSRTPVRASARPRLPLPARLATAAALAGAVAALTPSTALADLSPEQMDHWRAADQALASGDLVTARAAIEPLRAVAPTLPDGGERAWLDLSIARVLYMTGEDDARRPFNNDLDRLINAGQEPMKADIRLPSAADAARGTNVPCTYHGSLIFSSDLRGTPQYEGPKLNHWASPYGHHIGSSIWFSLLGPVDALASYTAADADLSTWPKGTLVEGTVCNLLPVNFDGEAGRGQRGTLSVPQDQPLTKSRRIGLGQSFMVQAFTATGHTVVAEWLPFRHGETIGKKPQFTTRARIAGHVVRVKAPSKRGTFRLELYIDQRETKYRYHLTDVTDVGVGRSPESERPSYTR